MTSAIRLRDSNHGQQTGVDYGQITKPDSRVEPRDIRFGDKNSGQQIAFNYGSVTNHFHSETDPLDKLPVASGAAFDSYMDQHDDECLPGTRTELLAHVMGWARSDKQQSIFWLSGLAGTGKSTISRTLAKSFKAESLLGASFFFKRGEPDRGSAVRLFPTLVRQLVLSVPRIESAVHDAVKADPEIAHKTLQAQFDKLLYKPLQGVEKSDQPSSIALVIDALDECENDDEIREIIRLLPLLQDLDTVRLRIFVTSRPELPIRLGFSEITDHEDFLLHKVPLPVIEHDITLFMKDRLATIRRNAGLPDDWPGEEKLHQLVQRSVPLFIFAATACRMLKDDKWDPVETLAELISYRDDGSRLNGTYVPALERTLKGQSPKKAQQLVEQFREIVGAIVLLESPLSISSLSQLLGIDERTIEWRLRSLHSVLNIPEDQTQPVRLFHLSFRDFLLDPETRQETQFWVDEMQTHHRLAMLCVGLCQRSLKRNICGLNEIVGDAKANEKEIAEHIPPALRYASRYWVYHLSRSDKSAMVTKEILEFLHVHILHWLELMGILDLMRESVEMLNQLQLTFPNSQLSAFLADSKRFVLKVAPIAHEAPLQIYKSGLTFSSQSSALYTEFQKYRPSWTRVVSDDSGAEDAEPQILEGHGSWVRSVVFSPDQQLIASGSTDGTINLWYTATGILRTTLDHQSEVKNLAFSADGSILASICRDGLARLWDVSTGRLQRILDRRATVTPTASSADLNAIAFSPKGQILVILDADTCYLWDTIIESEPIRVPLTKSGGGVSRSLAISRDGEFLLITNKASIDIRDAATGTLLKTLETHNSSSIGALALSPSGRLMAFANLGRQVYLWDHTTGERQHTLDGHSLTVKSLAFSPDSKLLASASHDGTVRVWNPANGELKLLLNAHGVHIESIAFSPDGRFLASGSNAVRIWDLETAASAQGFTTPHSAPIFSTSFSRDGRFLSTRSRDGIVRCWDTATGSLHGLSQSEPYHTAMAARFSPDSRRLAIVSKIEKDEIPDGMAIKIEDLSLTSRPHYIYLDVGSVNSIAFSPDSLLLAVICYPGIVFILDVTYGDLLKTIDPDSNYQNQRQYNYIEIFGFSPRGRVQEPHPMSEDRPKRGISRLWSAMKGKSPKAPIVESPTQSQTCESRTDKYAFSPDGRILTIDPDDWYFCDEHPPHFELPSSLLAEGYRSYCLFLDTPPGKSNRKPSLRLEYTTNGSSDENAASSSPDNTEICVEGENDEWVTFRGHSILWLPPEYRPFRRGSDSVVWATYKNILAMGHKSGQVTFIKFDLPFEGLSSCAGRTRAEVVHRPSRGAVYK